MPDEITQIEATVERMLQEWKRSMLTFWTLGLLTIRPMYGLEIANEIEESTQGALVVKPSTIYQMMARLEKRELVTSYQEQTTIGPPRTYYELTPAGRQVLRQYVGTVLSPESPIYAGLSKITSRLFQQLGDETK
jgi:PadR family transcriptional regulator PadR